MLLLNIIYNTNYLSPQFSFLDILNYAWCLFARLSAYLFFLFVCSFFYLNKDCKKELKGTETNIISVKIWQT